MHARCCHAAHNFFFLLVLLAPVLSNYVLIGNVTVGDAMIVLGLPYLVKTVRLGNFAILCALLVSSNIFISYYLLGGTDVYRGFYRTVFYYVIFLLALSSRQIDISRLFQWYSFIVISVSLALIFQWIFYQYFGIVLILQLPLEYVEPDTLNVIDHVYRSGGVFREPSYYALYVTPALLYFAFIGSKYKFVITAIAGVMSTSSLIFFIISLCYLAKIKNAMTPRKILISALLIFFILFSSSHMRDFVFVERIYDIFLDGGTLTLRFLPIFDVVERISSIFATQSAYEYLTAGDQWFSSLANVLATLGWIGLVLLLVQLGSLHWLMSTTVVILMLTTHFLSGSFSIFIAVLFTALNKTFFDVPTSQK
jgi:hypothetical protein